MGRHKRTFKSAKLTSKRQESIERANDFLKTSQDALQVLPRKRLVDLLNRNGQLVSEECSVDEVIKLTSEYMAFGLVKPCPDCGGELHIQVDGYKCKKVDDSGKLCKYKNHCPPHNPFVVPDEFEDIPFLKDYVFEKLFKVFNNSKDKTTKKQNKWIQDEKRKDKAGYLLSLKENKRFEEYYKNQEIVPEEEFEELIQKLRDPLPSTFRVTGFGRSGKELLRSIQNDYLNKLCDVKLEDKEIDPPKCLDWYPDGLAWQLDVERNSIRHVPEFIKLKQFLVSETNAGNISRQEAVSMIPPLVLDIQPHHKVLDMCAAPGSKTSQLIEFLHSDENKSVPDGVVIANDTDNKRCYLMCHQVKRLQTPCFMVVNHDAAQLPGFKIDDELMKFDRVLADVPCTGDGTLRKNVDAWQKWNPATANNLHMLQSRILRRGLEVLKTGGRLVYSTCSLNPIENEAVLAGVISEYGGDIEILDVATELPGLKFLHGKSSWKVMTRSGEWLSNMSEVPERLKTQIFGTMFPPTQEVAGKLHLERCMRILPHLQNTGGFFIAVLHKTDDPKEKRQRMKMEKAQQQTDLSDKDQIDAETKPSDAEQTEESTGGKRRERLQDFDNPPPLKRQKLRGYKEDPFIFLEKDDQVMHAIKIFYGLGDNFPTDQIMVRCKEGKKRNLYFVSQKVKQIAIGNEDKIKFINMGVKLFNRSESKYCKECDYRLSQEGIEVLYPYMTKRKINVSRDDVVKLLTADNRFITQLSSVAQQQLKDLECDGSIVYVFEPDYPGFEKVDQPQCKLIITGWKGVVSVRTFLPASERVHFLRLCGIEYKTKEELNIEKQKGEKSDSEEEIITMEHGDVISNENNTESLDKEGQSTYVDNKKCVEESNNLTDANAKERDQCEQKEIDKDNS